MRALSDYVLILLLAAALTSSLLIGARQSWGDHDPINPSYDLKRIFP